MREHEHLVQCAYIRWARLQADRRARRVFAIPNGRKRTASEAGKLKSEGVRAGVLDVFLPVPVGSQPGLWIEFKAGRNDLTPDQREEAEALVQAGYPVLVAWDWTEAARATERYLSGELAARLYRRSVNEG